MTAKLLPGRGRVVWVQTASIHLRVSHGVLCAQKGGVGCQHGPDSCALSQPAADQNISGRNEGGEFYLYRNCSIYVDTVLTPESC